MGLNTGSSQSSARQRRGVDNIHSYFWETKYRWAYKNKTSDISIQLLRSFCPSWIIKRNRFCPFSSWFDIFLRKAFISLQIHFGEEEQRTHSYAFPPTGNCGWGETKKPVSKYLRPALLHEHTTTHASLHTQTHTHVLGYKIVVESDCVIILHDSIPFLRAIIESLKPAIFKIYLANNHKVGTTFSCM